MDSLWVTSNPVPVDQQPLFSGDRTSVVMTNDNELGTYVPPVFCTLGEA